MRAEHVELLQSPWLIQLGAFYLNSNGSDDGDFKEFSSNFSCDFNANPPVMTLMLPHLIKLEFWSDLCYLLGEILLSVILQRRQNFGFCMCSLMCISLHFYRILFLIHMLWVVVIFSVSPVLVHLLLWFSLMALEQQVQSRSVQYAERFVFSIQRNWAALIDIKKHPFLCHFCLVLYLFFFLGNEKKIDILNYNLAFHFMQTYKLDLIIQLVGPSHLLSSF